MDTFPYPPSIGGSVASAAPPLAPPPGLTDPKIENLEKRVAELEKKVSELEAFLRQLMQSTGVKDGTNAND